MLFIEAMGSLLEGKYVSRTAWDNTAEYIILLPGVQYIWKIITQPSPSCGNWLPLVADLLADDWKVV